jgi:hypothetical protein
VNDERLLRVPEIADLKSWGGDLGRERMMVLGRLGELDERELTAGNALVAAEERSDLLRELDAIAADEGARHSALVQLSVFHHYQAHALEARRPGVVKW